MTYMTHQMTTRSNEPLPEQVVLCGCGYRVREHEGAVYFIEDRPVWNHGTRMEFTRERGECWRVEISTGLDMRIGKHSANHIAAAHKLVKQWRGDDFSP